MDEYNKNYTLYLVGGFFVFLVIVFVAVGLIVILLPAKNVQQFGPCMEQSECSPGLVCSMVSPTGKCLG
jgi:pilus assembly protein TadC